MDSDQLKVIEYLKDNKNVMLLGQAGTGKSKIVTELKNHLTDKKIIVTSTTGVSAFGIGGITIHSFLGIGIGKGTEEELYKKVCKNRKTLQILKNPDLLLVIDEISMMPLKLFETINYVFQKIRCNKTVFGGIQLLLTGDFLQLEPINDIPVYNSGLVSDFQTVYLQKNYRQSSDSKFQSILTNLRIGELTEDDVTTLKNLSNNDKVDKMDPIKLFSTNKAVNDYNDFYIKSNSNIKYRFEAVFKGNSVYYVNDMKSQFKAKNIDVLILKKGLKVMLTRNLNVETGLVNGSLGVISSIYGVPVVDFFNGMSVPVEKVTWEMKIDDEIVATAKQFPLIPAYASTIHKCQGLTINSAVIDLANIFSPHMIYVALSRVRNLDGIKLLNFNHKNVKINKTTLEFYNKMNSTS